jgi:hypothetical protein
MKLFTIDEANAMLPELRTKLERIQELYAGISEMREQARAAAAASEFGGGMEGGSGYVHTLYEIGKITTEINELGVQLKDYTRGLIDFPMMRGGRIVLLCWQLGEGDEIEWWHDTDAGFAGRQPL